MDAWFAVTPLFTSLPVALTLAAACLAAIALGILGVRRHRAAIRAERQRREDRVRRLQDYRREGDPALAIDGRREPYIGA